MGGDYNLESDAWFPTKYSTTHEEEWWAECFMLFVLGHLHGKPEKWFAKIIIPDSLIKYQSGKID